MHTHRRFHARLRYALLVGGNAWLFACSSTSNTPASDAGASDGAAAWSPDASEASDAAGPDGGPGSGDDLRTNIQIYCAARCTADPTCGNDSRTGCYAALFAKKKLVALEHCAKNGICTAKSCNISSSATIAYTKACETKVGACGGSIDSMSANDCDDLAPLFSDNAATQLAQCFQGACGDVTSCLGDTAKAIAPTECAGL